MKIRPMKKGSLSLSINAIVILVLAITMLGLGLGFTKGMFSKFSSKLEVPEPNIPATADEPIVLGISDNLVVQRNKEVVFSANVYNDGWDSLELVTGDFNCGSGSTLSATSGSGQVIPAGEDVNFKFIIPNTATGNAGTSICTLKFTGKSAGGPGTASVTKQITVKVQ